MLWCWSHKLREGDRAQWVLEDQWKWLLHTRIVDPARACWAEKSQRTVLWTTTNWINSTFWLHQLIQDFSCFFNCFVKLWSNLTLCTEIRHGWELTRHTRFNFGNVHWRLPLYLFVWLYLFSSISLKWDDLLNRNMNKRGIVPRLCYFVAHLESLRTKLSLLNWILL